MCMVDTMSSSSFSSRELNAQLKRALSGQQQGRRRMVDVWRRSRYSSIIAKRTIMHTHTGDEPKKRCLHIIMSLLLLDRFADICTLTREKSHGNLSEKNLSDFTLIWFSFLSFVRKPLEKSTTQWSRGVLPIYWGGPYAWSSEEQQAWPLYSDKNIKSSKSENSPF